MGLNLASLRATRCHRYWILITLGSTARIAQHKRCCIPSGQHTFILTRQKLWHQAITMFFKNFLGDQKLAPKEDCKIDYWSFSPIGAKYI